jgi:hypothetical protein
MGLSLVRGIVEVAHGTVEVASAPGKGTTFTLTLPAATPARASRSEAALASRPTAAVTVANERVGGLVRLFLDQMDLNSVRHPGPNPPDAALWVLDEPSAADLARFLRTDPTHRAVVLDGVGERDSRLPALDPESAGRVTVLPSTPSMGALRDALLRARSAG